MNNNRPWWQRPGITIAISLVLLILLGGAAAGLYFTQIPPDQPIQFPHRTHLAVGANCQYCHPAVAWSPDAGLPSTEKCWGCHQQVEKESDELDKLASFVEQGEQIPWVPVAMQPDFVQFDHRPHVSRGIDCQTCHGDMTQMTVAEPQPRQTMGWCLDCHQKMGKENFKRLSDCATCHY